MVPDPVGYIQTKREVHKEKRKSSEYKEREESNGDLTEEEREIREMRGERRRERQAP